MNVNLKSLITRLNDTCRGALEGAAGLCLSRTNYDVEIEHYLLKLLESQDADLPRILNHFEVGMSRLNKDLTRAIDRLKTGNSRTPALSPRLPLLVQEAWLLASIDFGATKIRSGHLLLALLVNGELGRLAVDVSREFDRVSLESLRKRFAEITAGSAESATATGFADDSAGAAAGAEPAVGLPAKTQSLNQFTIDLTARARE